MKAGYGGARRGQAEIEATAVLCTGSKRRDLLEMDGKRQGARGEGLHLSLAETGRGMPNHKSYYKLEDGQIRRVEESYHSHNEQHNTGSPPSWKTQKTLGSVHKQNPG